MSGRQNLAERALSIEGVETELEHKSQEIEAANESSQDSISRHTTPQELHREETRWNQYKRGWENLAMLEIPIALFSSVGIFLSGGNPSAVLGIGAANLPGAYACRNTFNANNRKNEIDSDLENWYLFEADYDLSDLFENSEPFDYRASEEMLENYQEVLADLEDVRQEIEELMNTDISNEDFSEDCSYGIQMARIEEDEDFGGYSFEVDVYLEDKQIGFYRGITYDEDIIEELEFEGVNAAKGRNILLDYFDLGAPFVDRFTKPEPL